MTGPIVVERVLDELGDWRVCVLTPFGGRIHAPWAMAATAKIRNELAIDVETMWSDDGFIVRFPETDLPPRAELVLPEPEEVEQLVVRQLGVELALRGEVPRGGRAGVAASHACIRSAVHRSGSSASAPTTCCRWHRDSDRSR